MKCAWFFAAKIVYDYEGIIIASFWRLVVRKISGIKKKKIVIV